MSTSLVRYKTTTGTDNYEEAAAYDAGGTDHENHPTDITDTTASVDGGDETSSVNEFKNAMYLNITFTGENVQGPQNLITVKHIKCDDGCTPKLTGIDLWSNTMNVTDISGGGTPTDTITDYNSYECGRRGKCDYSSGICECFSGYTGLSCGTITSLV